tara:strand:- start:16524 stop:18404 length:1881 start_codon:yes stop_codon:yes gene_type:complete
MAYEGLFGIGDAGNLNNRDLVKESRDIENHLQDVARFKEEQKRNEENRAKRRRENREDLYDQYYEGGEIHANYQPYIAGKVKGHHQWITENMDENGNIKDESLAEYRRREDQILQDVTALKGRTTDYNATVNDMRTEGTDINLYKKSEDGTYLIDYHEKIFLDNLNNGEINPNLPVDLPSMKGTPEPKRGSATYITKEKGEGGVLKKPDTRTTVENNIETTVSYYESDKVDIIENNIYEQLNPNELYHANGDVAKSEYIIDYMDNSNQSRFFEENDTGGVDDPNVLDPQSDVYNEEIADQYARWLAKDLTKDLREEKVINQKYVKPSTSSSSSNEPTSILTQTDVDKYNKPKKGNNSYNGFVAAAGTDIPVELKDFDSKLDISSKDIYVGPNNKQQEFTDPNGESITFEQLLEVSASKAGEDALFENAQLVKTMQLANGDFVGEYKLPGTNNTVLVSFDNMSSAPFKVVGKAEPSEHLKQFEFYKLQQELPKSSNASSFDKNKPGGTTTSAVQEVPKSDFEVNAYAGSKPPSTNDEIQIGSNSDGTPRMFSFENSLTEDNYDQLRKSGVREVLWRSYSNIGERTPTLDSSGVLTIPYTTKMEGGNDLSPGTPFPMKEILQVIKKSK